MKQLTAIVAVNEDGVIGANNSLPWRVRSDLRFFREQTIDQVVIMGRKTYDSLGGPLGRRLNIIVSRDPPDLSRMSDCIAATSVEEALARADTKRQRRQEVFVIGGATIYEAFAPYVDRYLMTEVSKPVPEADTWFNAAVLGDISAWNHTILAEGKANELGDEADFRIFELTSKLAAEIAERREQAIARYFKTSNQHLTTKFVMRPAMARLTYA